MNQIKRNKAIIFLPDERHSATLLFISIKVAAEHLIGTLSPCETSIVDLLAEFEPLTMATGFP